MTIRDNDCILEVEEKNMYIQKIHVHKQYRYKHWLEWEYWGLEKSAPVIAKECGITKHAIHYWMEKHGIPLRTISEAKQGKLHPWYGRRHTEETKKKMSDLMRGDGRLIQGNGSIRHYIPDHPHADCSGNVFEHRLIMEHELGRYLEPLEVVHHIDRDVSNNNPENLRLFECNGKHSTFHHNEKRYAKYVTTG